jgi:hypothetical protein
VCCIATVVKDRPKSERFVRQLTAGTGSIENSPIQVERHWSGQAWETRQIAQAPQDTGTEVAFKVA